jgi:regulator of replication initiation timing
MRIDPKNIPSSVASLLQDMIELQRENKKLKDKLKKYEEISKQAKRKR